MNSQKPEQLKLVEEISRCEKRILDGEKQIEIHRGKEQKRKGELAKLRQDLSSTEESASKFEAELNATEESSTQLNLDTEQVLEFLNMIAGFNAGVSILIFKFSKILPFVRFQLSEYNRIKEHAGSNTSRLRQDLELVDRKQRSNNEARESIENKMSEITRRVSQLDTDIEENRTRRDVLDSDHKRILAELSERKTQSETFAKEFARWV